MFLGSLFPVKSSRSSQIFVPHRHGKCYKYLCFSEYVSDFGYKGFNSLRQVKDVEELSSKEVKSILVGVKNPVTKRDACYNGLIVFTQGEFYGVIEPLEMVGTNFTNLKIRWWVGEPGITDFSQAPTKF